MDGPGQWRGLDVYNGPGGSVVAVCDCGTPCELVFAPYDPETGRPLPEGTPGRIREQEVAYTCDGCGSAHWLTVRPYRRD